jgi:hypothetical protein
VRRRQAIVALLALLVLVLPAPALGQGAGDEQYRDPFAGQQPGGGGQSQPQQGESPGSTGSTGQPAPDPAAPAQTADSAAATQAQVQPGGELPRTGFAGIFLLLAYGWALLIGGAALRRIA